MNPLLRCLSLAVVAGAFAACGGGTAADAAARAPEPLPAGAIPFRYDGHLYFEGRICDSLPATLVFDTGATGLYLDSLWLAAHPALKGQTVRAVISGGGSRARFVPVLTTPLSFGIDTLQWQSPTTPVLDLRAILGRRIDGLFGQHYLSDRCVAFDFGRGYIREAAPDTLPAAGFVRLPVEKRDDRIYVDMHLRISPDCIVEGPFLLDMGCGSAVVVHAPAARRAGFDRFTGKQAAYASISGGVGGEAAGTICRADSLRIGPYAWSGIPVEISRNRGGFFAGEGLCGVIGNRLLERFDCVVDFAAPALWLRPAAGFGKPFTRRNGGFAAIDRTDSCDGWVVTALYERSAPEGLRFGDVIVAWNGRPCSEYPSPDSLLTATGTHRIEVRRGETTAAYDIEIQELL